MIDLDLDLKSQECKNYLTNFSMIWIEFGLLLRLVGVINLILILSQPFSIQGREPYFYDFVTKNFKAGLYSDIYRPISFKTWYDDRNY